MPNDILGRAPSPYVGAFAADNSRMFLNGQNAAGLVVQGLNVNYQQPVQPLFEIGSNNRYYVVGRTSGQLGVDKVFGPGDLLNSILAALGNPCTPGNKSLTLELGNANCSPLNAGLGAAVALIAEACVATGVSYQTTAERLLVSEQIQVVFGQLSRTNPVANV